MPQTEEKSAESSAPSAPTLLAPDIGALVEYGLNSFGTAPAQYRVSSWIRVAPVPEPAPGDFLCDILFEACQEILDRRDGQRKRMQFCLREEATHLSLKGICGAIAPIELCKVTGMVAWTPEILAEEDESARRRGAAHQMIF